MKDRCPNCGETENLHFNYDYSKQHRPVESVLCNECGEIFAENDTVNSYLERVKERVETRGVNVPTIMAEMALSLSERCLLIPYGAGDMSDLGNELGIALGHALEDIDEDDIAHLVTGIRHGIDLAAKKKD